MQKYLQMKMKNFTGVVFKNMRLFIMLGIALTIACSSNAETTDTPRRSISEVLCDKNLTTFIKLLEETGLINSIDSMDNATFFVPTNEALARPETAAKLEELRADKQKLRDVLLFHMTEGKWEKYSYKPIKRTKSRLTNETIRTYTNSGLYPRDDEHFIVECTPFLHSLDDGPVYDIDGLLLPPTKSMNDIIQSDPKYSILREVLKNFEDFEDYIMESTFLAPVDEAFEKLGPEMTNRFLNERELSVKSLKLHKIPDIPMFCCSQLDHCSGDECITKLKTSKFTRCSGKSCTTALNIFSNDMIIERNGTETYIHIEDAGREAQVVDCDVMATNGNIVSVNNILWIPKEKTQQ